jgi:hypothetical protein
MDCLIGDGEKVFVVLLSAVVDHGGMNGKETAMDRGAAEVNIQIVPARIPIPSIQTS